MNNKENKTTETVKAYKGFNKDLKCQCFQYEIGKTFETEGNMSYERFYACRSPLEVFEDYSMFDSRFCEVEQAVDIARDETSTKVCSSKITIVSELKLVDMITLGIEWLTKIASSVAPEEDVEPVCDNDGRFVKVGSLVPLDNIVSSDNYVKIVASGNDGQIDSSGNDVQIDSSGVGTHIGSSGNSANIVANGDYTKIA